MRDFPGRLGRYHLQKKIGQGAMGVVFLAEDAMLERRVAIKRLRLDRLTTETQRRKGAEYFLHEARVVGNLNHSHITAVYDLGMEEDTPYIVMEYVEGANLKEVMAHGRSYSLKEKLHLLAMVARALHYAHQRGVLHRDIKPANIMILHRNRSPKITDFGIARVMDARSFGRRARNLDEQGLIPGTPLYMSPEQIQGRELDQRSDIFSLGVLGYEWLGGVKPFAGANLAEQIKAIVEQESSPLATVNPELDEELSAIVNQALAKDPADRFQSAEAFSDTLELYLNRLERQEQGRLPPFSYDQQQVVARLKKRYLFFASFSDQELYALFRLSTKERFDKGEYLIREGSSGTRMYIVLTGKVIIMNEVNGKRVEIDTLGPGSCVGEMAMIDHMPRSADVVAVQPSVAVVVNETVLRQANPKLCLKLYRSLAALLSERLRESSARYLKLAASRGCRPEE